MEDHLRAQYLGPSWAAARVRGTPYNTGETRQLALRDAAAKPVGNWAGCHSVAWAAGDRGVSNQFTKSGYPLGIMVNRDGLDVVLGELLQRVCRLGGVLWLFQLLEMIDRIINHSRMQIPQSSMVD